MSTEVYAYNKLNPRYFTLTRTFYTFWRCRWI